MKRFIFLLIIIAFTKADNAFSIDITQNGNVSNINTTESFSLPLKSNKQQKLPYHDVTKFGSLSKAIDIINNKKVILIISNEQVVQGHLTIPTNIILQFQEKGHINFAPKAELIIDGNIVAERKQIFSGAGTVNISGNIFKQVYPEWWGAKRDGLSDDTGPVQAAINSLSMGGEIKFADGTYVVDSITLASNISLVGSGRECVLKQKKNAAYCCSINPVNGGTPDPKDNKRNIGIRNIHFLGTVAADGFSEHVHLLNINAATDVVISDCWFTGWRGDGVYIGSSNMPNTERHNRNIVIKNCSFDGVNNDNRNAISIIDCNELEINNNTFTRCTRPNMPGAIDIEPDANPFSVIRNISITRNKFNKIGGNVGIVALVLHARQKELNTPSRNIIIRDNSIDGLTGSSRSNGIYLFQNQDADAVDSPNEITIAGNTIINTARPFVLWGVKGISIINNVFADSRLAGTVSNANDHKCRDVQFKKNSFQELGTIDGTGITVFDTENIAFVDNSFENIGSLSNRHGVAIDLSKGNVYRMQIENNHFKGNRSISAVLMNRKRHYDAQLAIHIPQNNSFDVGIEPISLQQQ